MADDKPITESDLVDGLALTAEALTRHQVQYAVIGGMAAGYRSQPRFTKDVDFLLQVPQIELPALLATLQRRGFQFDLSTTVGEWTQQHMTTLSFRGVPVDWLKPVLPIYQHVLDRATEENWLQRQIRVASVEGLILLKLLAFRTQDMLDIENLVAASAGRLDVDWIKSEWQTVATLEDARMVRFQAIVAGKTAK